MSAAGALQEQPVKSSVALIRRLQESMAEGCEILVLHGNPRYQSDPGHYETGSAEHGLGEDRW